MDAPTLLTAEEYALGTVHRRSYVGSEGCTNILSSAEECALGKGPKTLCKSEGCTNGAVKGGVCSKHGAKVKVKICIISKDAHN